MAIIVPNSGSTLTSAGLAPNSASHWGWIGLQTLTTSGCAAWYWGTACTSGSELMTISLSPMSQVLYGPFNGPDGLYVTGVAGACALWMVRKGP